MVNKKNNTPQLWIISTVLSIIFFITLVFMWAYDASHYTAAPNQISQLSDIPKFLRAYPDKISHNPIYIPTGIFLQSFFFKDPQTVIIAGVIWQKFNKQAIEKNVTKGFILPENNTRLSRNDFYDIVYDDYQLVGWGFVGASLYQQFDYSNYPFDQQVVWIRIMPSEFEKNVVLVPDLASYHSTQQYDKFGIASDITLRGLYIQETYFNFSDFYTNTNFGLKNSATHKKIPELSYNIVIRRHFFDIFLLYLLPVIVVWGLLFGLTMVMSSEREKAEAFKFSAMGSLSTLGGAFFAILFSQINLRLNFSGHPVTYLEFFYFVTYGVIFFLALNSYFISSRSNAASILMWRNNLLPKILFWPVILGMMVLLTWIRFFT